MSTRSVLVVDSNEGTMRPLAGLLDRHGYDVLTAGDGEEAIASASENGPAMIIMSVQLSGRNGYEITRSIKDREEIRDIPVVLLTAANAVDALAAQRDWGLKAGAAEVLPKPVDESDLLAAMEDLVHHPNGGAPARRRDAAEIPGLGEDDLSSLVERLAQYIGPVADMLVRRAAGESDTRSELFRRLADHIDDQIERERFMSWAVSRK